MAAVGQTVSHYTLLEQIGTGGMGVVYKARDTRLGRPVAIKFLPEEFYARGTDRDRFIREAQSASALNHPNICTIHEIDEADDELFIVMEYVEGRSLRTTIDMGPMVIKDALTVASSIADGLRAAHAKMIVHRDIKPENIIITGDGTAKIVDFGVAHSIDGPRAADPGPAAGTVAYMSPEQLRGDQVDRRTDIWSLGIVLYEMLTGTRPFAVTYDEAAIYAIANETQRPVSAVRPDVPASIDAVVTRCLEKSPDDRYHDAAEFIRALEPLRKELHAPATQLSKSLAVLPFADISPQKDNRYFSDGLTEEIIANLSKLRKVKIVSRTSVMHYDRVGKSMTQIAGDLGVQYVLEGSVRKHGANVRITAQLVDARQDANLWAETFQGSIDDIFDIQEKVAGRIVKSLKMRLTPDETKKLTRRATNSTEAYQLYLRGRYFWNKRNPEGLNAALRYFEQAIEKDPGYAPAWTGIADAHTLLTDYGNETKGDAYGKAKAAVGKALECDDQLAEAHASLGILLMLYEMDWQKAGKEFRLAISLNPNYATAHHWHAEWLSAQGRHNEAIAEISLAEELDPVTPAILKDKGTILYYARDFDGAIEQCGKALEFDPRFAVAHRIRSIAYLEKGMYAEALTENQSWGDLGGNPVDVLVGAAYCHARAGHRAEAIDVLRGLDPEATSSGNICRSVALVHAALGQVDTAFDLLEKCLVLRSEALGTIKVDPKIDPLRNDPRYESLVKRVGLQE